MAYTLPNVLVTTEWVAQHATDVGVRVVEVDVYTTAYDQGHVPGAAGWNWTTELCDTLVRDIVPMSKLEELLSKAGIDNKTAIVLYGDNNNWFAAWAFWQLKIYGHDDVRIMDGGRKKWLAEGRELSTRKVSFPSAIASVPARQLLPQVEAQPTEVCPERGRLRVSPVEIQAPQQRVLDQVRQGRRRDLRRGERGGLRVEVATEALEVSGQQHEIGVGQLLPHRGVRGAGAQQRRLEPIELGTLGGEPLSQRL